MLEANPTLNWRVPFAKLPAVTKPTESGTHFAGGARYPRKDSEEE